MENPRVRLSHLGIKKSARGVASPSTRSGVTEGRAIGSTPSTCCHCHGRIRAWILMFFLVHVSYLRFVSLPGLLLRNIVIPRCQLWYFCGGTFFFFASDS